MRGTTQRLTYMCKKLYCSPAVCHQTGGGGVHWKEWSKTSAARCKCETDCQQPQTWPRWRRWFTNAKRFLFLYHRARLSSISLGPGICVWKVLSQLSGGTSGAEAGRGRLQCHSAQKRKWSPPLNIISSTTHQTKQLHNQSQDGCTEKIQSTTDEIPTLPTVLFFILKNRSVQNCLFKGNKHEWS